MATGKMLLTLDRRWWFKAAYWTCYALVGLGLTNPERAGAWLATHGTVIKAVRADRRAA